MKIAVAQMNSKIADFEQNTEKILRFSSQAKERGADMIAFPEMCVCGYPPLDLLNYDAFIERNLDVIRQLCDQLPDDLAVIVGYVDRNLSGRGKPLRNRLAVVLNGNVVHTQDKTLLPTYDVFDEDRYFEPAAERRLYTYQGKKIALAVCEDIWSAHAGEAEADSTLVYHENPVAEYKRMGADILIAPSASPFYNGKTALRRQIAEEISIENGCMTVYVNAVGANDSLIFDGNSIAADSSGRLIARAKGFEEDLIIIDTEHQQVLDETEFSDFGYSYENLNKALVLGVRDYMRKTGFRSVNLGLSGGIDSALVAALAVEALGSEHVHAYAMPSRYSSDHSLNDARELARNLGITMEEISIEPMFTAAVSSLEESFAGTEDDVTEENMQARIRGILLMAWSNKKGSLLLTTGNKSELATGYCTLYGDMCGAVSVIGDLFKTEVFGLCRHINERAGYDLIPEHILIKPPSAELRFDQKDEDSLPPYEILDEILKAHLLECLSVDRIVERGFDRETVEHIIKLVERCEYKRRQAAIVIKVSQKAFGYGRRIPIARRLYETD
jgi:NAD+ synthase (glutamine-hydrolysing)